ncbi:MAG: glycosyltransferase [Ktedonobacterales bacterium]|nr:glycosyltransferase [Ktedonobacterales bacterium]
MTEAVLEGPIARVRARARVRGRTRDTSARLRVLLATNSVAIGGMEKHVELLARDLDRSAVEVYAACPRWEPVAPWVSVLTGLVAECALLTPDRRYGWLAMARETFRFQRQLRRWRIQVMHLHLTTFEGGMWALLAARLAGVRTVICTEHLAPERPLPWMRRLRHDLFTCGLDALVCVSSLNWRERARHLYTPAARVRAVNNGIDVERFEPSSAAECAALRAQLGIPAGAPVVGSAVRFVAEKGLDYLIAAMPRVLAAAPDAYLLLAGDGPLKRDLERQAEALGIRDRVIFAGFQPDPRPYVSLMDVFVLPVPFGSASIGLLEAMALRRAVIVTFGGEDEAVIDGETGLWVPPRDPEALAAAIVRVTLDADERAALGTRARQRIEAAFSSRRVAADLLTIYQRGVSTRSPRA